MTLKVSLATCADYPHLSTDERMMLPHLAELGCQAQPLLWDRDALPDGPVVVRSCWDYDRKQSKFRAWLNRLEASGLLVLNPPGVCRWNMDKTYLDELASQGVAVPRTAWLGPGADLVRELEALGVGEAVVKPVVSMMGNDTWRVTRAQAAARQADLDAITATRPVMLQEYLPEVETAGEISLVFVAGEYSHAVHKQPRQGEFRVHEEHGGRRQACRPEPAWLEQAQAILSLVPGATPAELLYARVDGIPRDGWLMLMELELIDPSLYFECHPPAARTLARALVRRISERARTMG